MRHYPTSVPWVPWKSEYDTLTVSNKYTASCQNRNKHKRHLAESKNCTQEQPKTFIINIYTPKNISLWFHLMQEGFFCLFVCFNIPSLNLTGWFHAISGNPGGKVWMSKAQSSWKKFCWNFVASKLLKIFKEFYVFANLIKKWSGISAEFKIFLTPLAL